MNDYTPEARGEIRSDLTAMYLAGRKEFPARAHALSDAGSTIATLAGAVDAHLAHLGDPAVGRHLLEVLADVGNGVRRAVQSLNTCAQAVVYIADDFAARDEFAREVFHGLERELTTGAPPRAPLPKPIDKGGLQKPGAGPEHPTNPDPVDPKKDLESRDSTLEADRGRIENPELPS